MNIGIVVYSQTGNTRSVAEGLRDRLAASGHQAAIEPIELASDPGDMQNIRFHRLPLLDGYDALVFAAPVQGFQLCAAMKAYLNQMPELRGRKAACFVTKHWPSAWTGANGALKAFSEAIAAHGGKVCGSGFVGWKNKRRERDVEALLGKLGCLFG